MVGNQCQIGPNFQDQQAVGDPVRFNGGNYKDFGKKGGELEGREKQGSEVAKRVGSCFKRLEDVSVIRYIPIVSCMLLPSKLQFHE